MKSRSLKRILIILGILFLPCIFYLVLISGENHFRELEVIGPRDVDGKGDTIYHTLPAFWFTNQEGRQVGSAELNDKIFVANFFFVTCPTICPKMNDNLQKVVEKFRKDDQIKFISFTVNPENDSVPVLLEYANNRKADHKQWWFLTGDKDSIYDLARDGFLVPAAGGKTPADFFHSQDLILIDREKRIRGVYDGLDDADVRKLSDEILVLEQEYKQKG